MKNMMNLLFLFLTIIFQFFGFFNLAHAQLVVGKTVVGKTPENLSKENAKNQSNINPKKTIQSPKIISQKKSQNKATPPTGDRQIVEEENNSSTTNSFNAMENLAYKEKIWGIGAGISVQTITSPSELRQDTSPGPGFHLWGRYQWNSFLGSEFGLNHYDFASSQFGITSLKYNLLLQTGNPEFYWPYISLGGSINNLSPSAAYNKDYTQFGVNINLGFNIPWSTNNKVFWIPEVQWFQVFKKNEADSVNGLSFLFSIGFFFDDNDFKENIKIINNTNLETRETIEDNRDVINEDVPENVEKEGE